MNYFRVSVQWDTVNILFQSIKTAVFISVACPKCGDKESIVKFGRTINGKQRFCCQNKSCDLSAFILDNKGWQPEIKKKIIEMTLNGSGIRDISRVLGVCTETVMSEIKKRIIA